MIKLNIGKYTLDTLKPFVIPIIGIVALYNVLFSQNYNSFLISYLK